MQGLIRLVSALVALTVSLYLATGQDTLHGSAEAACSDATSAQDDIAQLKQTVYKLSRRVMAQDVLISAQQEQINQLSSCCSQSDATRSTTPNPTPGKLSYRS